MPLPRQPVLAVDSQDVLRFGRKKIPVAIEKTYHRLSCTWLSSLSTTTASPILVLPCLKLLPYTHWYIPARVACKLSTLLRPWDQSHFCQQLPLYTVFISRSSFFFMLHKLYELHSGQITFPLAKQSKRPCDARENSFNPTGMTVRPPAIIFGGIIRNFFSLKPFCPARLLIAYRLFYWRPRKNWVDFSPEYNAPSCHGRRWDNVSGIRVRLVNQKQSFQNLRPVHRFASSTSNLAHFSLSQPTQWGDDGLKQLGLRRHLSHATCCCSMRLGWRHSLLFVLGLLLLKRSAGFVLADHLTKSILSYRKLFCPPFERNRFDRLMKIGLCRVTTVGTAHDLLDCGLPAPKLSPRRSVGDTKNRGCIYLTHCECSSPLTIALYLTFKAWKDTHPTRCGPVFQRIQAYTLALMHDVVQVRRRHLLHLSVSVFKEWLSTVFHQRFPEGS